MQVPIGFQSLTESTTNHSYIVRSKIFDHVLPLSTWSDICGLLGSIIGRALHLSQANKYPILNTGMFWIRRMPAALYSELNGGVPAQDLDDGGYPLSTFWKNNACRTDINQ